MAKKKYSPKDWRTAYKAYALEFGELISSTKQLLEYKQRPFVEFRACFESLEKLEINILIDYFQTAKNKLQAEESFHSLSIKEQQLTFLYLLIEEIEDDEYFLEIFQKEKIKNSSFLIHLQKGLNEIELEWSKLKGWRPDFIDKLKINPKRALLSNHALSCMWFYLKDKSKEKQDTDAFIEKTTDLLFKVSDTSTLHSMLDFGKFMYSRKKTAFG